MKHLVPRYQQIALEIASRIVSEEYKVGDKIYASSSLAGQYSVSSETARRAICLLSDLGIVSSLKGSGVVIKSQELAISYVKNNSERQSIESINDSIASSFKKQKEEMQRVDGLINDLLESTKELRSLNPFMPFQISISSLCKYLNKTIAELAFWQNTSATVIALKREDILYKSPGPYILLQENDILYFITQDDTPKRVKEFLYGN